MIEHAPLDEVTDLASEANILIWTGNFEEASNFSIIDKSFVGVTSCPITIERLGNHFYTRLVLNLNDHQDIRYLRICGMTQSSAQQYAKAFHQCLKLLASIDVTNAAQNRKKLVMKYQQTHLETKVLRKL